MATVTRVMATVTVKYGTTFHCPRCYAICRRAQASQHLFVYTVPRGHEVGKNNRITCFWDQTPFTWRVEFDKD